MTKTLSERTRADWLSRRWIDTTPPGNPEMVFTDARDFPDEQRTALLDILNGGSVGRRCAASLPRSR